MQSAGLLFYLDEHLPARILSALIHGRGHRARPVQISEQDQAILASAEEQGAIIITADTWFLRELTRRPVTHRRAYHRAGVVQIPGNWESAETRLIEWFPLIEVVCSACEKHANQRVAIDVRETTIIIHH